MPKIIGSCKTCGNTMQYWPSQARTYCSQRCKGIDAAIGGMPVKPKTGRHEPCVECGAQVWRQKHQEGRSVFCSVGCKNAWQSRNRIARICGLCGCGFETSLSQERIYCSRACMGAANYRRPLARKHNGKPAVLDNNGYVRIFEPSHPRATKSGWIFEHRWIVEQALGRTLARDENVHHVNHIRHDNRIENFEVLTHSEHSTRTGHENGEALKAALDARQKLAEYERRFGPLS